MQMLQMNKKILPPIVFLALFLMTIGVHIFAPIKRVLYPPVNYLGVFLILFGFALIGWAYLIFLGSHTTIKPYEKPTTLHREGPFRFSRNPMYLGMVIILLGSSTLLGTATTFIFPGIFFIIIDTVFIPTEEKILEETFGNRYLAYTDTVRRWI